MADSELSICNRALANLGITARLVSTDDTVAGITTINDYQRACALFFEPVRDSLIASFPWNRNVTYGTLTLISDGTGEAWDDVWSACYEVPVASLQFRGFVTPRVSVMSMTLASQMPEDWIALRTRWSLGLFDGETVIFADTDEEDPPAWWVERRTDIVALEPLFNVALVSSLAVELASQLKANPDRVKQCQQRAAYAVAAAQSHSINEDDGPPGPDGSFITSRGE